MGLSAGVLIRGELMCGSKRKASGMADIIRQNEHLCMTKRSHSKNTGLETHENALLYVFHHVFFVSVCTFVRSRHMGKPNPNNACLF